MAEDLKPYHVCHPGGCDDAQQMRDLVVLTAKAVGLGQLDVVRLNEVLCLQIWTTKDALPAAFITERQLWAAAIIHRLSRKD
jgi:hypothetical protein